MVSKQALGLVFTTLQLNRIRRMESFNYLLIPTAPHQATNKHAQTIPQLAVSHYYCWLETNPGGAAKRLERCFLFY